MDDTTYRLLDEAFKLIQQARARSGGILWRELGEVEYDLEFIKGDMLPKI